MSNEFRAAYDAEMKRFVGEIRDLRVAGLVDRSVKGGTLDKEWRQDAVNTISHLRQRADLATSVTDLSELVASAWYPLAWLFSRLTAQQNRHQFLGFVEAACEAWWDSMTHAQLRLNCATRDAHRGLAAYVLSQLYLSQNDRGSALRWAALGQLADVDARDSGGDISFRFGLGVPEETLSLLTTLASEPAGHPIERLPEWLLVRSLNHAHGLPLLGSSPRYSHHASRPFVAAAVAFAFDDVAASRHEKGERLERLVAFLLSTIPGMRPRQRVIAQGQSAETDLVATLVGESMFPLPERTMVWLAECKNWDSAVPSKEVGAFFAKMRLTKTTFGLLVVKSGVTGAGTDTHGERLNRDLAMQDGQVCLVVSDEEIRALGASGTFRAFVDSRYERWRFGTGR